MRAGSKGLNPKNFELLYVLADERPVRLRSRKPRGLSRTTETQTPISRGTKNSARERGVMRVRETKTGNEFHIDRDAIAGILQAAGIIEIPAGKEAAHLLFSQAEKPTQRTPRTEWVVSRGNFDPIGGELRVFISCATCGSKSAIFRPTEKGTFTHGVNCGGVESIPADVLERYRELAEPPKAVEKKRDGLPRGTSFYVEL